MTLARQRCWTHPARVAVCRCPGCARFFCRECVTEHEARLLCAACIARTVTAAPRRGGRMPAFAAAAGGLLVAWAAFYATARAVVQLALRSGGNEWPAP